jgi:hypothetical protein
MKFFIPHASSEDEAERGTQSAIPWLEPQSLARCKRDYRVLNPMPRGVQIDRSDSLQVMRTGNLSYALLQPDRMPEESPTFHMKY